MHVHARRRKPCEPADFTPRLSETRSDDQELREAGTARRGLRDSDRHLGEGRTSEIDGERMREEPLRKQEYRWQEERQEAEVRRNRVIVHAVLALTEAAETGGEDEQSQGS